MTKEKKEKITSILIYLFSIAIVIGAICFAVSKSPDKSFLGLRFYIVRTPSMEPALSVGDLAIVKAGEIEEIDVGDIITFHPSSDTSVYLTHRVTEKLEDYEGTGALCFKTKGDANNSEDSFVTNSERVVGKVLFGIPYLGYIINFIKLRWAFVLIMAGLMFLFAKEIKLYKRLKIQEDAETEEENIEQGDLEEGDFTEEISEE